MQRLSSLLALAAALVALSPAAAADPMPLYRATLAAPNTARHVVRDVQWICAGNACAAPRTATAPDTSVCTAVVRKLGPLTGFAAGDRVFDEAQLARCNAAAVR